MVNPLRTELLPSFVSKTTTAAIPPPLIVVTDGPPELVTVIALPLKLMFSYYVPGATSTVSPLEAALIAAWIVGWPVGTLIVVALALRVVHAMNESVTKSPRLHLLIKPRIMMNLLDKIWSGFPPNVVQHMQFSCWPSCRQNDE